jgi:thiosulfate dehydrogenase
MRQRWVIAVALLTVALYVGCIVIGLHLRNFSYLDYPKPFQSKMAWRPPTNRDLPPGPLGDSIRQGALIFNETPLYASQYTHAHISCADCHAAGGVQPYASPMVGLPARFPMFNQRAGHVISLQDRVQECFVRSENGTPIPYQGSTMQSIVDYITWLSRPEPDRKPFVGRGLVSLPKLTPDPQRGQAIYAAQCAGCHGLDGQGRPPLFPPLWGPYAFNDGAGMHRLERMAPFVQHNMPQNRMGILSAQQAWDVSAYIHTQPRPAFSSAYAHF